MTDLAGSLSRRAKGSSPEQPHPRVHVLTLGGTIAMTPGPSGGVAPALTAEDLIATVPEIATLADIGYESFLSVPGAHLGLDDVIALARRLRRSPVDQADGVVIVQGTDTLEEVAFALDLLLESDAPVVVTGAMRHPSQPGADGAANLLSAVCAAASPACRGLGSVVVMSDEIHAARFVAKSHATSPGAFRSPVAGPLGWVVEGSARIVLRPEPRPPVPDPGEGEDAPVALIEAALGDDGRLLSRLVDAGYRGLVLEAFGAGHVSAAIASAVEAVLDEIPVVLASRTGSGQLLEDTYGFPGSEKDLLSKGAISAGWLAGPKARLLLSLLLRTGFEREDCERAFADYVGAQGPSAGATGSGRTT